MDLALRSDTEIIGVADAIMNKLMDASTNIDYERHISDFSDRAKSVLSKDRFRKICAAYQSTKGFFDRRELVAIFRRPDSVAIVWKQSFTRQAGEFVAELVLIENDDRVLVDHVMVF